MQAFSPILLEHFVGTRSGDFEPVGTLEDGRLVVQTPQVVQQVRARFACPTAPGALAEDGNALQGIVDGTAGVAHWEQSVYFVRPCPRLVPCRCLLRGGARGRCVCSAMN